MVLSIIAALALAGAQPDAGAADAPQPVKVAVLATPHLSGAPQAFEPDMLSPVLDRLAAFEPSLILVEAPSAEHVRFLVREAERYPGLAEQFGSRALALSESAAATIDLSPIEAEIRAAGSEADSTAGRRELAALNARAGDAPSAVAHWRLLPAEERTPNRWVSPELAAELDRLTGERNETYLIGSALAARLGHAAVTGFDDWSAGDLFLDAVPDLQLAMQEDPALQAVVQSAVFTESRAQTEAMTSADSVLEAYRYFNAAEAQSARAAAEWDAFLAVRTHPEAARARLAAWQARNLRMAANIVEAGAGRPGARVLVIVGASHKPYLETALRQAAGLEIVETETLLAAP